MPIRKRPKLIQLYVSEEEQADIRRWAKEDGRNVSDYLRRAAQVYARLNLVSA